ncbi:MAG: hypothetical protein AB9856_00540 [Cellulosilyticaceae bacterium]
MNRNKLIMGVLIVGTLMSTVGYAQYTKAAEVKSEITIIKDTKDILPTKVVDSKIEAYEKMSGYGFLTDDKILATKANSQLPVTKIDTPQVKADLDAMKLYTYRLDAGNEKDFGTIKESQRDALISPDQKYVFYSNGPSELPKAYIADIDGKILAEIADKVFDSFDFSNARWISETSLVLPCHSINGFATINLKGEIEKFNNVETGTTATKDPLNGISLLTPIKIEDKIYYIKRHHEAKDDEKLKVYDTKTKQTKVLVENVTAQEIVVSPNKKQILILGYEEKIGGLYTLDLVQNTCKLLVEEEFLQGASWSPDATKIAYIGYGENKEGIYSVDINTKEKALVAAGNYINSTIWNAQGDKMMVTGKKAINDRKPFPDEIDVTYIVSFE